MTLSGTLDAIGFVHLYSTNISLSGDVNGSSIVVVATLCVIMPSARTTSQTFTLNATNADLRAGAWISVDGRGEAAPASGKSRKWGRGREMERGGRGKERQNDQRKGNPGIYICSTGLAGQGSGGGTYSASQCGGGGHGGSGGGVSVAGGRAYDSVVTPSLPGSSGCAFGGGKGMLHISYKYFL